MDWIWPSHGPFDYVSLPKGKKGKIEGCIILLLDISPQKSCSSRFTSWFTHIWGHTMGVFNVEGWDSTKINVYFNYDCNFFQETYAFNHVLYPSKVPKNKFHEIQSIQPRSNLWFVRQKPRFFGPKHGPPNLGRLFCFRRSFAFVPGVGAMLRAWLSGSTSPLAPWWMKKMEILMEYIYVYILDMADTFNTWIITHIHDFTYIYMYVCTVYMYKCVCVCST